MNKAVKVFAGVVSVASLVASLVVGLNKVVGWIESPESTEALTVISKGLLVLVVLGLFFAGYRFYLSLKNTHVTVSHVRQLGTDGYWHLYTVTFNKLGEVVDYVVEDVPGYFGEELQVAARTYTISLEEARHIAKHS